LSVEEIIKLAEIGKKIEEHYGRAQDIEWAIDRDLPFPENVFIVQSRPETVWSIREVKPEEEVKAAPVSLKVVAKGIGAGKRDIGFGKAKVVFSPEDADKLMQKGDVLVTTIEGRFALERALSVLLF